MEVKYIEIPKKSDEKGSLSFMEAEKEIPFTIKRVYYIYDLKDDGNIRGKHAHHTTQQALFCIQGSVKIGFDDGKEKQEFVLDTPNIGIYIPTMMRHHMTDFSDGCILLVIASEYYDEKDYIRNYGDFIKLIKK